MTSPETTEATRGNTSIERLAAGEGDPFRAMTFEAYRRLLALEPVPRSPEQGDRRLVEPIALGPRVGLRAAGLRLAEWPASGPSPEERALYGEAVA
ncbi:MAG: hypothetical protein MI919_39980, partial [Holophagales bacterium]|nr:hypothetical protein [Holophagales bacterium]